MLRFVLVTAFLAGLLAVSGAAAPKTEMRDPKELGRVAILPFLDISGEKQEAKTEYRDTTLAEVEERFQKHEIAFVPRAELQEALDTLNLVPTDEEDRTKEKLKRLADHLKVRYVVTGIIHQSGSDVRRRGAFGKEQKVGDAKVQFRVFDGSTGRWSEELERTATSTARANNAFQRSNKLRTKAVRDATKKSMELFLAPYPKVHDEVPDSN